MLALLLATSGSTGAPRLVRLSAAALDANAAAIGTYLEITSDDRAALTLPLHYCYGLSVINSNLLAGAAVLLSESSVVDPAFWATVRDQGGDQPPRRPPHVRPARARVSPTWSFRICGT